MNARDGEPPAAMLGTATFPLDVGDKWFYSYSSAINGKGSVVRQIADTTNGGFRRVIVITHFGDSTSVKTEYWLYRDEKLYFRTNGYSLGEYDYPLFVSSLKSDSSYSSPYVYDVVTWHLTTTDFAGAVYASQILDRDAGMHPISFRTIAGTAQSIGLYYLFEYRFEGVRITKNDTSRLVGLLASGVVYGDTIAVTTVVRSVSPPAHEFALSQNYPNPFNPSTTIRYGLPNRSHVTLTVFNTLGQQVATLVNGEMEAGYHEIQFDAKGLSSGVYLYRMQTGSHIATKKLILLR
jgi:hypothetical protein